MDSPDPSSTSFPPGSTAPAAVAALAPENRRELAEQLRRRGRLIIRRLDEGLKLLFGQGRRRQPMFRYLSETLRRLADPATIIKPSDFHAYAPGLDEAMLESMAAFTLMRTILAEEAATALGGAPTAMEIIALNSAVSAASREQVLLRIRDMIAQVRLKANTQAERLDVMTHRLHGNLNAILMMLQVLRHDLSGRTDFSECVQDIEVLSNCIIETVDLLDKRDGTTSPLI